MADASAQFLTDLALVTAVAAATTLIFHKARQPVVVGYLIAGAIIGPFGPLRDVQATESVQTLSQLAIVFLMFSLGLEFRLRRLARSGLPALGSALAGMAAVMAVTLLASQLAGWSSSDALFLGAILAISSTVVAAKAITERGQQGQRWVELAMAVLIVQDVAAVAILALLGAPKDQPLGVVGVLGLLGRLATFAMAALVLGLMFVPRLVDYLARRREDEVLVVTLAGLGLGVGVLALLLGFSPALGAFLIGAVVAEAGEAWVAAQRVLPLRDLFTAVFFVSVGMLLDPSVLVQQAPLVALLAVLMVATKLAVHAGSAFLLGAAPRDAFRSSVALAQIGEFSLVIAVLGRNLGEVTAFVLPAAVALAIASALWTPYLLKAADPLHARLARSVPLSVRAWAARYAERRSIAVEARAKRTDRVAGRLASRAALNGAAVGLILLATASVSQVAREQITIRGLTDHVLVLLPWLGGAVLAMPFAFNAAQAAWMLGRRRAPGGAQRSAPWASPLVAGLAALGLTVFVSYLVLAPFLPPLPVILFAAAAFLGASLMLWETMKRLHARIEAALERTMGGADEAQRLAMIEALQGQVRWGVEVASVDVRPGTAAVARTLRNLELRARSGATLVAVQRKGRVVVNPPPEFALAPGDAVVLLGDSLQIQRARDALLEAAEVPETGEARLAQVHVEAGSGLAGLTLAESALREKTGATIVGVLREGERFASPGAGTRLQPDDWLLVVGSEEQVSAAEALARQPASPGEAARGAPPEGAQPGPNS